INNERLSDIYGDLDFINAFGKADDTLAVAARSLSEIITSTGHINLDFKDINATLRNGGAAIISSGFGEGEHRVTQAIEDALNSPLLKDRDIMGSKRLLFNLFFSREAQNTFRMSEVNEITDFISSINPDVKVIWGVAFDESLGEKVKMTILATGFDVTIKDGDEEKPAAAPETKKEPARSGETIKFTPEKPAEPKPKPAAAIDDNRITEEYGKGKLDNLIGGKERASYIILSDNQLDNDDICDILEKTPTYRRDRKIVEQIKNGQTASAAPATDPSGDKGRVISF
ncbi:MAG: cell division protein FtsZ, partial [Duncaniella sp.]|nr:cell division protein FtsZ [Duncaniella sp.]